MAGGSKMQGDVVIGRLSCLNDFTVSLKQALSLCRSLSNNRVKCFTEVTKYSSHYLFVVQCCQYFIE